MTTANTDVRKVENIRHYRAACIIRRYLMKKWADDIRNRGGDAPHAMGVAKWRELGIGGGDGAGIVWEGFYEWTNDSEIEHMQTLINHTGFTVWPTAEWMIEII